MLCEYGCENEATYFLKRAKKWCCSKSYNSCSVARKRNKKTHLGEKNCRYGKKCTEKTRHKISAANKGNEPWNKGKTGIYSEETLRLMSEYGKGFIPWNKNKKGYSLHSEETKELYRKIMIGPNNPNWKGGIAADPYCAVWLDQEYKESIKERDDYMCLNPCCLKIGNTLAIHHVDYNKKNCGPMNLITLCDSCNGRANGDREWHMSWYQAIINRRYGRRDHG